MCKRGQTVSRPRTTPTYKHGRHHVMSCFLVRALQGQERCAPGVSWAPENEVPHSRPPRNSKRPLVKRHQKEQQQTTFRKRSGRIPPYVKKKKRPAQSVAAEIQTNKTCKQHTSCQPSRRKHPLRLPRLDQTPPTPSLKRSRLEPVFVLAATLFTATQQHTRT